MLAFCLLEKDSLKYNNFLMGRILYALRTNNLRLLFLSTQRRNFCYWSLVSWRFGVKSPAKVMKTISLKQKWVIHIQTTQFKQHASLVYSDCIEADHMSVSGYKMGNSIRRYTMKNKNKKRKKEKKEKYFKCWIICLYTCFWGFWGFWGQDVDDSA